MSNLKIGMYEQDITPQGPVNLPGQFYKRISTGVESNISVSVFACEAEDDQLIIVSCDLGSISDELMESVRELTAKKCDIPDTSKITLSATHVHTCPGFNKGTANTLHAAEPFLPEGIRYVPVTGDEKYMPETEYFDFLSERISNAVAAAWNSRQTAYIAQEFGRAVIGHCRRVVFSDGTAKMYGIADKATFADLESGNDSGIELLYVFDENKKPMGALVNIACPSQVMEHCSVVSSDYWGKAREYIKEKLGENFVTVGLCSAAGCQSPRDMIRFVLPDTLDPNLVRDNEQRPRKTDPDMYGVEGAIELGGRVADVVLRKIESAKDNLIDDAKLCHKVMEVKLPLRKVTETDNLNAKEDFKRYLERANKTELDAYDMAALHISAGIMERYIRQETEDFFKIELHVARLGNIAFATNPFELFLDYGNKIRARSVAEQTFMAQLSCGKGGYLPTEKAEKGSHYSAYVASGNVGHEGGELLVSVTLDAIKELFS